MFRSFIVAVTNLFLTDQFAKDLATNEVLHILPKHEELSDGLLEQDPDSLVFEQQVTDEPTPQYHYDKHGLAIPNDAVIMGDGNRAQACAIRSQCLYEMRFHLHSTAEKVRSAVEPSELFEHEPVTATYKIMATPHVNMTGGGGRHVSWKVEGKD